MLKHYRVKLQRPNGRVYIRYVWAECYSIALVEAIKYARSKEHKFVSMIDK